MLKIRFVFGLVMCAVVAASIVAIQGPAWAEVKPGSKEDQECAVYAGNPDDCMKFQTFGMRKACLDAQTERYKICKNVEMEKAKTGSTTTPLTPTKAGQNVGTVGGVKKVGEGPILQPSSGGSTTPKTKMPKDVGSVGGVKKAGEGWSSPSTSGVGTIKMQSSGPGKKKDRR